MKRTLTLRKDTLVELTADDLRQVAAGDDLSALTCTCLFCYTTITRCGICDIE